MRPYVLASGAARAPFGTLDYTEDSLPIPLHSSAPPKRIAERRAVGAFALSVAAVVVTSTVVGYAVARWVAPAVSTQIVM
jgi:hypothetical protein